MSELKQTPDTFDDIPLAGSQSREQARAERDASLAGHNPNTDDTSDEDIVPIGAGIMRRIVDTAKKHPVKTLLAASLTYGAIDAAGHGPVSTAFENSNTRDTVLLNTGVQDTGKGPIQAIDDAGRYLVDQTGVNENLVVWNSLSTIPNDAEEIALVDEGRTYKFIEVVKADDKADNSQN